MFGLSKYEKRLKALEEHQDEFRRQMSALQLEWDETYDKVRTLVARLVKRDERAAKASNSETSSPEVTHEEQQSIPGMSRAQLVQQQILARRRRINGGG